MDKACSIIRINFPYRNKLKENLSCIQPFHMHNYLNLNPELIHGGQVPIKPRIN